MSRKGQINKGCQRQLLHGTEHPAYEHLDRYLRQSNTKTGSHLFGTQLCSLSCSKKVGVVFPHVIFPKQC
jgi:hypothetical protein